MSKSIVISERDNIAAVVEGGKAVEFIINRGDMLLGDVYLASVENVLPSIDAAFVNLGGDKMGFLHSSDIAGKGALTERLKPKQQLLVQIIKEPTGHKGPRVTTAISLPGRFLVFMPDEKGANVSRKIASSKERGRLKSIVNLLKPKGVGVIIRTEAEGQKESEIQEDLELLVERWNNIVTAADTVSPPNLLYRDQDLLYKVIREACTEGVKDIIVDTQFALNRANQLLQNWNMGTGITVSVHKGTESILVSKGIDKEIRSALQTKVNLPSGGYLYIQTTEALTVIDVNSGKFTSSATQNETIRKTNLESIDEIARQLRLRNIGGMVIIDLIDMENRVDQLAILEELEMAMDKDKAKPQVGQLSDLGLVELTRHRQGQSLAEIFTKKCPACMGSGFVIEEFNFSPPPQEHDYRIRASKIKNAQKIARLKSSTAQQQAQPIAPKPEPKPEKPARQIKTSPSPSIIKEAVQKKKEEDVAGVDLKKLDQKSLKEFFKQKGFVPKYSDMVRFSALPSHVARELMSDEYIMDVFSILQEIESYEQMAFAQQEQPVSKPQQPPKEPVAKEKLSAKQEYKKEEPPAVLETQDATEVPVVAETPAEEAKVEVAPQMVVDAHAAEEQPEEKPVEEEKNINEVVEKVEEAQEADEKEEHSKKKAPAKRTRPTASKSTTSSTKRKTTTVKKTAPRRTTAKKTTPVKKKTTTEKDEE